MATFDMTPRGNFRVDRDSLHASDGYKRQVEALGELRKREMDENVAKAVEKFDGYMDAVLGEYPSGEEAWQTIRARLVELEAENERLRKIEAARWLVVAIRNAAVERAEKAEAMLREFKQILWLAAKKFGPIHVTPLDLESLDYERMTITVDPSPVDYGWCITAHLSENGHG